MEGQEEIVGLLDVKNYASSASEGDNRARVRDCMCPLSEADLIGADATILDFIKRVRSKPLLVVAGERIQGLVAWSDLQKLPVRAAIFALVTGFELTMYEAIRAAFRGDGWQEHLNDARVKDAKNLYAKRSGNNSDVDLLLCTQFCDKRTILEKHFFSGPQVKPPTPTSKGKFESAVKEIEELRNDRACTRAGLSTDLVPRLRRILLRLEGATRPDNMSVPGYRRNTRTAASIAGATLRRSTSCRIMANPDQLTSGAQRCSATCIGGYENSG